MEPNERENETNPEPPSGLLSDLEKKLYSRKNEIKETPRTYLHQQRFNVNKEWEGEGDLSEAKKAEKKKASPYAKLFLVSFFFFVMTLMYAGYSFLGSKSTLSPENVTLSLYGPVSVRGGDTLSFQVMIENKNPVALSDVVVGANFPDGTRYPNNPTQTLSLYRKKIGAIGPGEVRTETVSAILLGADNSKEEIKIYLEFGLNGSSASYTSSKIFTVNLTTSPLVIRTGLLKEITSGQILTLGVDAVSSSPSLLDNVLLKVDYPIGFTFESADPAPFSGNNIWELGSMSLGDTRHIDIKGKIEGENSQEKIFRLYGGVAGKNGSTNIDTMFSTLLSSTVIKKPFLNVNLLVNGSSDSNYVLTDHMGLGVGVLWTNTLSDKVMNGEITVTLGGEIIDPKKVEPRDGGLYNDSKKTIFWDERSTDLLSKIEVGGKSGVGFSIGLLPFVRADKTVFKNPVIDISVGIKGNRVSEKNVPEVITTLAKRSVKVATTVDFSSRIYYFTGPIENTGPLPPRVGKETAYTIVWKVSNTVNNISGVKITSRLPSYVRWVGRIVPDNSDITYNTATGDITWNAGVVPAGAGYETAAKEVAFQVGLTPFTSQLGDTPELLFETNLSGTDDFTGINIISNIKPLTTVLSFEPQASHSSAVVIE